MASPEKQADDRPDRSDAPSSGRTWLGPMYRWFTLVDVTVIILALAVVYAVGSIWREQWMNHCAFVSNKDNAAAPAAASREATASTSTPSLETTLPPSRGSSSDAVKLPRPQDVPAGAPYVSQIRLAPGSVLQSDEVIAPKGASVVIAEPTAPPVTEIASNEPPALPKRSIGDLHIPSGGAAKPRPSKKKSAASVLLSHRAMLTPNAAPPPPPAPRPAGAAPTIPSGGSAPPTATSEGMGESFPHAAELVPQMALAPRKTIAYGASPMLSLGSKQPAPTETAPSLLTESGERLVDPEENTVVKVFYGTDRFSVVYTPDRIIDRVMRFLPAGLVCALAFGFAWIATEFRKWWAMVGMAFSLVVGVTMIYYSTQTTLTIAADARAQRTVYTARRNPGGQLNLGICEVSIPTFHHPGQVEEASILRLEVCENENRHIVLKQTKVLPAEGFFQQLRDRVDEGPNKELFVFVHGFNVSFDDAAKRTAQMAHDMHFEGAPVFFSWPANQSSLLTYTVDETNVAWAMPHLKKFLTELVEKSGATSINLVAHSMGNRALTGALKEIQLARRDEGSPPFNQVILAAPDVDAEDFAENLIPYVCKTANRTTLYASKHDDALKASQLVHRYARAGDSSAGLVIVPGLDTIDVSAIDSSPWGHSYYGSSDIVLADIRRLFATNDPPEERIGLVYQQVRAKSYWSFDDALLASRETTSATFLR